MEFKIVRPMSSQSMTINWLEAHTDNGNVVILPGHAPMVTLLAKNKEITYELSDFSRNSLTIAGGILQVSRTSITLIVSHE